MNPLSGQPGDSILHRIADATTASVTARMQAIPRRLLETQVDRNTRCFYSALEAQGLGLIAEFKPRSPSRGPIRPDASAEDMAQAYQPYAAAVSVLCDKTFFGGSHAKLARMRRSVTVPVLCKDFILTEYQIIEARAWGADAILLMASLLPAEKIDSFLSLARGLGMEALVEVHSLVELEAVLSTSARIVGINSRNLKTMEIDLDVVAELAPKIPRGRLRVAESGLHELADIARVRDHVDAVLIGTSLMAADDPEAKIQALGWTSCR